MFVLYSQIMVTGEPGVRGVNAARIVIKANTTEWDSVCISYPEIMKQKSNLTEEKTVKRR